MKKLVFLILVVLLPVNAWGALREPTPPVFVFPSLPSPPPLPDFSHSIFNPLSFESNTLSLQEERLRLEKQKNLQLKIKQLAEQLKTFRKNNPIPGDVINQPKKNED